MKGRNVFVCQACGAQQPRWMGRCPECAEFGTVVAESREPQKPAATAAEAVALGAHDLASTERIPTGVAELDRVLGGGLAGGSVVLLAGEPGIGKSTLALQAALSMGRVRDVLLVCGEESPQQVRARAERLGPLPDRIGTIADASLDAAVAAIAAHSPDVVIVDSVQSMYDPELPAAPGSVTQVRESGGRLARVARERGICVLLVGHVTKEGAVAGPRILEHLVDVVLSFEGDRSGAVRILRPLKNRFGSTQESGFFEMRTEGLVAIRDASAYLLADRTPGLPGSVLATCVDGRRPFVVEVQALVCPTAAPVPRRSAIGVDASRLPMLTAVIQRRGDVRLGDRDVFVSAVGGIRVDEPACDLPIVLSMLSSYCDIGLPDDVCAFGEVGLAGEIRRVPAAERRLAEARAVGCLRAIVPHNLDAPSGGLDLVRVKTVRDAKAALERLGGELRRIRGA